MRSQVLLLCGLCAVLLFNAQVRGVPEKKQDPMAGATYVGQNKCMKCHSGILRAHKKTVHSKAWENLPKEFRDPEQTNEKGRACISCHVTGYGEAKRGGFVDAKKSKHLLGVQCEACHGPGSKHVDAAKAAGNEKFKLAKQKLIVRKTTRCTDCHDVHQSYRRKYGGGG